MTDCDRLFVIGQVEYQCEGFLEKNKDTVNEEQINVLKASKVSTDSVTVCQPSQSRRCPDIRTCQEQFSLQGTRGLLVPARFLMGSSAPHRPSELLLLQEICSMSSFITAEHTHTLFD